MALLVLVAALVAPLAHSAPAPVVGPQPPRVAVMVLENRSYEQVIGNPAAPYLSGLARRGALATHDYALTHPSLPNYLALTTGGYSEITGNCARCDSGARSLANQLDDRGISWHAYFEGIQGNVTSPYSKKAPYNRHYDPFVYTDSLGPADLATDIGNFHALHDDLAAGRLPTFSWIAPSVPHDGHDHSLRAADRFASKLVPKVVRALGPRGVLLITWDEGARSDHRAGGGRVALIATGPGAARHARVAQRANHYALLHTIEHRLGLEALGHARGAPVLTGLFAR